MSKVRKPEATWKAEEKKGCKLTGKAEKVVRDKLKNPAEISQPIVKSLDFTLNKIHTHNRSVRWIIILTLAPYEA